MQCQKQLIGLNFVRQELNESPSAFMERLKVTARKYTNLDPEEKKTKNNTKQKKKPHKQNHKQKTPRKNLYNWPLDLWDNQP